MPTKPLVARSRSYCENQANATRLVCARCAKPYDVTHAEKIAVFVCAWCKPRRATDISGNQMEGGATGP